MNKGILVVILVLVLAIGYGQKKMAEHTENSGAAEDYAFELCSDQESCADILDLNVDDCIQKAYRWSSSPGADTIELKELVGCLNDRSRDDLFVIKHHLKPPFPSS